MQSTFENQVVWITGASSGIGEALAKGFSQRGSKLVLSARNSEELQRVCDECLKLGAQQENLLVLPLDVTDYAAIPVALERALSAFSRIDMLINNAGVSQRSLFVDTQFDVYRTLLEINVLGQIAMTQTVVPQMLKQGSGHLAITSSVAGKVGVPLRTGYCASKHAVMGFFDSLRSELAVDNIKVTTITPGFISTNVSKNAITGDGQTAGFHDLDISGGMDVTVCVNTIMQGFEDGLEEIAVGGEMELGLLELKRSDPAAAFRAIESMAAELTTNNNNLNKNA